MSETNSRTATWSLRIAIASLLLVGIATAGIHLGILAPLQGFVLFLAAAIVGSVTAIVLGLAGVLRTGAASGRNGRAKAVVALVLAVSMVSVVLGLSRAAGPHPVLNDVSTDLDEPPQFTTLLTVSENTGRDMSYPEAFKQPVRLAYADVTPVKVEATPEQAFDAAVAAAEQLGWAIVRKHAGRGVFEATDTSGWFRFVDDIVVRVRGEGSGSRIDVRSKSRDGKDDFAVNANRIRTFTAALRAR